MSVVDRLAVRSKLARAGFTLVELMVVIVILGILATLFLGNFTTSQAKARDAQRKSDLNQIMRALEAYNNDKGSYPPAGTNGTIAGVAWGSAFADSGVSYMAELPKDPKSDRTYVYSSNQKSYRLYAKLENEQDSVLGGQEYTSVFCTAAGQSKRSCNFAVTSPNGSVGTSPDGSALEKQLIGQ